MLIQVKKDFEYLVIYDLGENIVIQGFHQLSYANECAKLNNGHIIKL